MFSFILNLLVLTLIFSFVSTVAFIVRKTLLCGREGMMYPVWIVILAISIIPFGINMPNFHIADSGYSSANVSQGAETIANEAVEAIPVSEDIAFSGNETTVDIKTTDDISYSLRRMMASGVGCISEISAGVFALWLAGTLIVFVRAMYKYTDSQRLMLVNSTVCSDERTIRILAELRDTMKIKRRIKLRIFGIESLMSPCVCGFFIPTLYIETGCLTMSDDELLCVLTHELTHMRRFDMITKLFCIFATSVHWFNPTSKKVREAVLEDCELSCDYSVVKAYGNSASSMYMGTILDFTERYSKHCKLVFRDGMSCGLFASEPSGAAFMKMRYANMKNFRGGKLAVVLASIFATCCLGINMFALSCSSTVSISTFGSAMKLSPAFDIMLRAYYDLDADDYITPEMVDGITSIKIGVSREYNDRLLVEFTVNSDGLITRPLPIISQANYTENLLLAAICEHAENNPLTDSNGNAVYDLANYKHFKAYYVLTDVSHLGHISTGDSSENLGNCYILDKYSTERELDRLHGLLDEAGLLDAWTISSRELDVSSLGYFTNLEEIEFAGLTPIGYEFPENVRVITANEDGVECAPIERNRSLPSIA